ncbi:MAG: hypothetical protein ACE5JC_10475, partial [Candidatus Zixiibacteriota bacterium]
DSVRYYLFSRMDFIMNEHDEYLNNSDDYEVETPHEDVDQDMYIVGMQATRMLDFYTPFFRNQESALDFLEFCVGKYIDIGIDEAPSTYVHGLAHELVLQPHTIVSLADSAQDSDYLRLVLLMTLVESTSKIFFDYHEEGLSKKFCKKFFEDLCLDKCRALLLTITDSQDLDGAIEFLYKSRCEAIHEGRLHSWDSFNYGGWKFLRWDNSLYIYEVLRHLIMTGCINAIRKSFDKDCYERACPGHDKSWELICGPNECNFSPPSVPLPKEFQR